MKKLSFKFLFWLSFGIYLSSCILSFLIILISNLNLGDLTFNNYIGTWFDIFIHNLKINFIIILGGAFFSIPSIFLLVGNGLIVGTIIGESIIQNNFLNILFSIGPHGIVEIPTFIYAGAVSFEITKEILINKFHINKSFFVNIGYKMLLCSIFTLIAAIIEGL
ncbi:stage II sporulation protein M [Clostridium perfringens]|uniref:stage II sporulation protein M n=1 Tax=Clostridium perfringens TaxID=1502 RepID=UPI0022483BC2|nr:stage II sporulation protein M [Clostridium perfringens]MCX0361810.1 stage II sporulation protein M [Clostridium perfringens]